MRYPFSFLNVISLLFYTTAAFSQVKDSTQISHEKFFKAIADKGGVWEADNPKCDNTKETDYKTFILRVMQKDALSIEAEILGINTQKDTARFWTFNEYYAVDIEKK